MLSVQQLVVGIFQNRAQTEQALNELHQLGFDSRHIRVARHGISMDGVIEKIKSLFEEEEQDIQDILASKIYNDLVDMGMLPEDALYYQREFEAGRFIVAVLRSGAPLVATSVLARNGGYIVNDHYVELTNLEVGASMQEPPTEDVNAQLDGANENSAPSADNDQDNEMQGSDKDVVSA